MNPDAIFVIAVDLCGSPERTNQQLAESHKGDGPMVLLFLTYEAIVVREGYLVRYVGRG